MVAVAFAPFEPDRSRFNYGVLPDIVNAIPTADGWGPLKGGVNILPVYNYITDQSGNRLMDQSGNLLVTGTGGAPILGSISLPAACTGMFAGRKANGTERIFAGTATALYEFDKTTYVWNDVTRASGGAYNGTSRWSFVKFGSVVYAANGTDAEQKIDLELDTKFSNNTTAPIAKYIAAVGDFMFRGNIASLPYQIQWSAINDPQSNTATVNLSDYQDMPIGDEVMGIVPLSSGAHVWMRSGLHNIAFNLLDTTYSFTRQTLTEMRGTSAPNSITPIAQDDYVVYCDDGFWRYNAGQFTPIGAQRVNAWFLTECDQDERDNILAMPDPERQIVWFAYTASDATRKMLGYHYILDRWCLAEVSLQASCRARTFVYSSLTSAGVTTDLLRFAVIDSLGRLSYLVGDNLAATIETNEYANDAGFFVNRAMLAGDPVTFTVTQKVANYRGGSFTTKSAISPSSRTKSISLRGDGKVHKFTVNIPAATTWTNITSMEVSGTASARS